MKTKKKCSINNLIQQLNKKVWAKKENLEESFGVPFFTL